MLSRNKLNESVSLPQIVPMLDKSKLEELAIQKDLELVKLQYSERQRAKITSENEAHTVDQSFINSARKEIDAILESLNTTDIKTDIKKTTGETNQSYEIRKINKSRLSTKQKIEGLEDCGTLETEQSTRVEDQSNSKIHRVAVLAPARTIPTKKKLTDTAGDKEPYSLTKSRRLHS